MDYFTSDLHFQHRNVIQYNNRPFPSVDHMNEELVRRWNERVQNGDNVYVLGDVGIGSFAKIEPLITRLRGRKHLIWGNHDSNKIKKSELWVTSRPYAEISSGGEFVILHHYGQRVWNRCHYGSFHLYGHSHGNLPAYGRSLDVGVDVWDYRPVTLNEIKERLADLMQLDVKIGHHDERDEL